MANVQPFTGDGHTSSGSAWATFGTDVIQVAHATYDFNVDGGAVGLITPKTTVSIPQNAIIVGSVFKSSTAVAGGGGATIAIGTSAGSSASSLLGATAIASFSTNALVNGIGAAAPFNMSAAGNITLTVGTAALTAGKIEIYVEYIVSPT